MGLGERDAQSATGCGRDCGSARHQDTVGHPSHDRVAPNRYKGTRPASTSVEDKDTGMVRRRSEHGGSGYRCVKGNCHCNEKSRWLFRQASPGVGTGRGRIAGRAALQAVQDRCQQGVSTPSQAAKQGQHGVQGLRHLARGQAGLFFLSASLPRSRKKCRSMHRVMWRCQPCRLRPSQLPRPSSCLPSRKQVSMAQRAPVR